MPTLKFQPEADRYYAEGYWRDGDLWSDFARRAAENPDKPALILDDRMFTFDQLRRAAVGVSVRLAEGGVEPGDVVILLGRHSIEAAVAMLGCMHRGVVIAPLPPMFNESQLSALIAQTRRHRAAGLRRRQGAREVPEVADQVPLFLAIEPDLVDRLASEDPAGRARRPSRRRPRDGAPLLRDDLDPEGHRPLEQHAALRHRGDLQALGADRRGRLPRRLRVRLRRRPGVRLLPAAVQRRDGSPRQPLERRGCPAADRGASTARMSSSMPTHSADLINAKAESDLDLPSMRVLAAPGLTRERRVAMREAFGVPPLGDYGLSEVPGHAAHGLHEPDAKIDLTEGRPVRRHRDPDRRRRRAVRAGEHRRLGDRQRPEPVPRLPQQRRPHAGVADRLGRLPDRRSRLSRRRRPVRLRRPQQGHHPPRRRDDRPAEVEPVILRHPSVHEVAVVPLPDERLGERACAAIIPVEGKPAPTLEELQQFLDQEGVAKYTWPESVEVFDDFPRTPSLKVVKRDVVAQILERGAVTA